MKFVSSLISVKDIEVSKKFYGDLFDLEIEFDFGINIQFKNGLSIQQDFHTLMDISKDEIKYKTNNFELYFECEDLDLFIERLNGYENITYVHPMKEYNWGQRVIRFYDPDFHIIEVGESIIDVARRYIDNGLTLGETSVKTQLPIEYIKEHLKL